MWLAIKMIGTSHAYAGDKRHTQLWAVNQYGAVRQAWS